MNKKLGTGVRIMAVGLIAGGLLGLLGTGMMYANRHHGLKPELVVTAVAVAMFSWTALSGLAMWRRRPWGLRSAKVLFALQIPTFCIARMSYEFSNLFSFRVMAGNVAHQIGGNIGSSFNLSWAPPGTGFMVGLNLIAVLAFTYLVMASRSSNHRAQ